MSEKAKRLIIEAIEEYQSEDGASRLGSYRDAVTDLLHLAHSNETLRVEWADGNAREFIGHLYNHVVGEGYDMFMEERATAELKQVNELKLKELPLYIDHDWEFEDSGLKVAERLKGK